MTKRSKRLFFLLLSYVSVGLFSILLYFTLRDYYYIEYYYNNPTEIQLGNASHLLSPKVMTIFRDHRHKQITISHIIKNKLLIDKIIPLSTKKKLFYELEKFYKTSLDLAPQNGDMAYRLSEVIFYQEDLIRSLEPLMQSYYLAPNALYLAKKRHRISFFLVPLLAAHPKKLAKLKQLRDRDFSLIKASITPTKELSFKK